MSRIGKLPISIPAKSMKNHDITGSEVFGFVHFKEYVGNNTATEWKRQWSRVLSWRKIWQRKEN